MKRNVFIGFALSVAILAFGSTALAASHRNSAPLFQVSANGSIGNRRITPGAGVKLASVVINAGSAEGVMITRMAFKISESRIVPGTPTDLSNLVLRRETSQGEVQIGATQRVSNNNAHVLFNPINELEIPRNASVVVNLYADINPAAVGRTIAPAISSKNVTGIGISSGAAFRAPRTTLALPAQRIIANPAPVTNSAPTPVPSPVPSPSPSPAPSPIPTAMPTPSPAPSPSPVMQTAPLVTIRANTAFASGQTITRGARTKLASFVITSGDEEGVVVNSMRLNIAQSDGAAGSTMNTTNFMLMRETSQGEIQMGSTQANAIGSQVAFSALNLTIAKSTSVVVNFYADTTFSLRAGGPNISTSLSASSVQAYGVNSAMAIEAPAAVLPLQTIIIDTVQ